MHLQNIYKAQKGIIRVAADVDGKTITSIRITGDFFVYPEESILLLEKLLKGCVLDKDQVMRAIDEYYKSVVDAPLLTKEDFANAITGVLNGV